jgi:hypothetical protein
MSHQNAGGGRWQYRTNAPVATQQFIAPTVGFELRTFGLDQVSGFSLSASRRYFQLFEATLSAGLVPLFSMPVEAGQPFAWQPAAPGFQLVNSPALNVWGVSTTPGTYTASADTFWVQAQGRFLLVPS